MCTVFPSLGFLILDKHTHIYSYPYSKFSRLFVARFDREVVIMLYDLCFISLKICAGLAASV